MNDRNAHIESNVNDSSSKYNFHSISKFMNEENSNDKLDNMNEYSQGEENNISPREKVDELNNRNDSPEDNLDLDSSISQSTRKEEVNSNDLLLEFLRTRIEKRQNDLNNCKEDFDRLIRSLIEKCQARFSSYSRNKIVRSLKQTLSEFDLKFSFNEVDLLLNNNSNQTSKINSPNGVKAQKSTSPNSHSLGYNSVPSPSSSSSSNSSTLKTSSSNNDLLNKSKKQKLCNELQSSKTSPLSFPIGGAGGLNKPPQNTSPTPNPYASSPFFDPEFLRLAAASASATNPLFRFPDFTSLASNPYLSNFSNLLMRPNITSSPQASSNPFLTPNTPLGLPNLSNSLNSPSKAQEESTKASYSNQNGGAKNSNYKIPTNKSSQSSNSDSYFSTSKLKLSSKLSKLNGAEIQTIKSLITSYRESAAFLSRSAEELEQLIGEMCEN